MVMRPGGLTAMKPDWFVGLVVVAAMTAGCGTTDGGRGSASGDAAGPGGDAADQSDSRGATTADVAEDVDTDAGVPGEDDGPPIDDDSCCKACSEGAGATLQLSCAPTAAPTAVVTGPCAVDDASAFGGPTPGVGCTSSECSVLALESGDCHVTLTFASGFTYSTDVQFTEVPQACCGCPGAALAASPSLVMVEVPMATCMAGDGGRL